MVSSLLSAVSSCPSFLHLSKASLGTISYDLCGLPLQLLFLQDFPGRFSELSFGNTVTAALDFGTFPSL